MTHLIQRPSPMLPENHQLRLLRTLVSREATGGVGEDKSLAVAFFRTRLAAAGFLTPLEARQAASAYGRDKASWRRELVAEARCLCTDGLPVYALQAGSLGRGLDWSALPTGPHGDRLYRLRAHRFGFLPRLSLASCLGAPTLPAIHATLAGWIRWARTAKGAQDAYFSNLVIIYRLLALSWSAPFLAATADEGDETAARICLQMFRILAADCRHLAPLIGKSAPNNHRLADRFAAWFLAACYPELATPADAPEGLELAWQAELRRQFREDGTNFEQSMHYHELGCEMASTYLVMSLRRGTPPGEDALAAIAAMLRFQAAMADRNGKGFPLGDATDDPLLPLDSGGGSAGGAWRILYRALFDPEFPPTPDAAAGAERAYWLLAALRGTKLPLRAAVSLGQLADFPDGGYFSFRDEAHDDYLLFRSGPRPGANVSPGHAMSDLLSVYWNRDGNAVLEPAGTYSYAAGGRPAEGGPAAPRAYFRSPAAHNGPLLGGHDPLGAPRGRFRDYDNGARAATKWLAVENVLAWAESRLEEPGPLKGWRRGVLRVPGHWALVYDRLPVLPGDADLTCRWQFAPEAAAALSTERQAVAKVEGLTTYVCGSQGIAAMELVRGRQAPAAGWVSRRYGELAPAPQLICRVQPGSGALAFVIGISGDLPLPEVAVVAGGGEGLVVAVHQGDKGAICAFGRTAARLEDRALDIDFDGEVLWLAFGGGRCLEMRALGMRRIASRSLGLDLAAGNGGKGCAGWEGLVCEADDGRLAGLWKPAGREPAVADPMRQLDAR